MNSSLVGVVGLIVLCQWNLSLLPFSRCMRLLAVDFGWILFLMNREGMFIYTHFDDCPLVFFFLFLCSLRFCLVVTLLWSFGTVGDAKCEVRIFDFERLHLTIMYNMIKQGRCVFL